MTIQQLFLILRARWRLVSAIWLGTFALVLAFNLWTTPQYTSYAVVVVDSKTVDVMAGTQLNSGLLPGFMATQIDIAQSERVIMRAALALGLDHDEKWRARWQKATEGRGEMMPWVVDSLQRRIVVRPSRESSAMTLSFSDPDPAFAAAMTKSLMQSYIDTTLELRVEPAKQFNTFFDDRARQLRDALERAQLRLSAYQRANGLLPTDDRIDVESARLGELSSQVVSMQSAATESGSRRSEAASNPDRVAEVLNSPLVGTLSTDLARAEAHSQELRSRLGKNHPSVIEAQASIDDIRSRLNTARQAALGSITASANISQERLTKAKSELDEQRSRVLQLKAKRDEAAVLQRDVENSQKAYDAVLARVSQTDLESQNRQTNVSVLQNASVPTAPSSPRVVLNAVVAILLGFLLAVGSALAREMSDRRLRSEADVAGLLKQPLLMMLPKSSLGGRRNKSQLAQKKLRVLRGRIPSLLPGK